MLPPSANLCPHCHAALSGGVGHLLASTHCPECGGEVPARREFERFRLIEPLGRGAMSVVFRAIDGQRHAEVALKIIRPPFSMGAAGLQSFEENAHRLLALDHPHCARVHAAGVHERLAFIAQECLPGGSLGDRLATRGRLSESETLQIGLEAASGLAAAHAAGLMHRALNPRSIRFSGDGAAKITDIGEQMFADAAAEDVGIVRGQLCYVAPERLHGDEESARSDMYSLGALLFEAITGRAPFDGESNGELLREIQTQKELRVEDFNRGAARSTCLALNQLLRIEPSLRPESWDEVCESLLTARDALYRASVVKAPVPKAPRTVAPAVAVRPVIPVVVTSANPLAGWLTLVMLLLIVTTLAVCGWWYWQNAASQRKPAAPAPVASLPSTTPVPSAAPIAKPPPAKVPAKATPKAVANPAAKKPPNPKPKAPATPAAKKPAKPAPATPPPPAPKTP